MRTIGNGTIRRKDDGITYGSGSSAKQLQDWRLASNDDAATVIAANYFNPLAGIMQVGEMIDASLDLDGTPVGKKYMVTANTGTVVTIAAVT